MERIPNWETALNRFLADRSTVPFAYGRNDCALFASDAVLAMTGKDPAQDFRGKYRSMTGSIRVLRSIGNGDLESTFSARFKEKPVSFAKRGDLVWDGEAVGVCFGDRAVFVGENAQREGLFLVPMTAMKKAWAV